MLRSTDHHNAQVDVVTAEDASSENRYFRFRR